MFFEHLDIPDMDAEYRCIEYSPEKLHTHTVVFLHGRGDTAEHFISSLAWSPDSRGRTLPQAFPTFRWVFPKAKMIPCAAYPGQTWSQWFDVYNTKDFLDREELQAEGLSHSVAGIRKILAKEATILDGRWDRIILAGISQGAATSVHTLFNLNLNNANTQTNSLDAGNSRGLAAFLGFSCRLPFPGRSLKDTREILLLEDVPNHDDVLRNTPMLLEHCVDDPLVLIRQGQDLRDSLRNLGAEVTWKQYPNGGHWFNAPAGIDDVVEFLNINVMARSSTKSSDEIREADTGAMEVD